MPDSFNSLPLRHTADLIKALRNGQEVALVDLREEADFASGHPLFAVNLPLSKLEIEVLDRIPSRTTPITLYDNGQRYNLRTDARLTDVAYQRLKALGYVDVALLAGDLDGWQEAGGEVFIGINVPNKAFKAWSQYRGQYPSAGELFDSKSLNHATTLAQRAGVQNIDLPQLIQWQADSQRTLYLFDVRTLEEYQAGHLPGARHVTGEQLLQQTEHYASVRGARIVLLDDNGQRANIVAAWLAQQNWRVFVLGFDAKNANAVSELFTATGNGSVTSAPVPAIESIDGERLEQWLAEGNTGIIDLTLSANFRNRRIPSAVFTARSQLPQALAQQPAHKRWVVTCGSGFLARYAVTEVAELTGAPAYLLDGGTLKWIAEDRPLEHGDSPYLNNPRDKYLQPEENADAGHEAKRGITAWEDGLVAQLERDNTHGFHQLAVDEV
ncbi:hypothetical protein BS639_13650 [Rouxiella silvae]|uniref:Rhodanese domain-containing protein n=1 Tax=Rouxiella silvae TaxID=1646373 RepID=A0ABX3TZK5_9GAMM|nr:rhodanese-like domain-containing protein [Rouxiella silvae]ORJ20676.1 hypothetical protein BS639_13650 [Rouxiella silvae]